LKPLLAPGGGRQKSLLFGWKWSEFLEFEHAFQPLLTAAFSGRRSNAAGEAKGERRFILREVKHKK